MDKETLKQVFNVAVDIDNQARTFLNSDLLKRQKISPKGIEKIKKLHVARILMEDEVFKKANDGTLTKNEINTFLKEWTKNQFALQKAWKFPLDEKFHKFFTIQGCACALDMDVAAHNFVNYPNGNYRYSHKCYLHRHLVND